MSPRRHRSRPARWLALALLVAFVVPATASAEGYGDTAARVADGTFDVLLLRTTGAITTLVGAVLFIPAAILASPGGLDPVNEGLELFILNPWNYAVKRPLGQF